MHHEGVRARETNRIKVLGRWLLYRLWRPNSPEAVTRYRVAAIMEEAGTGFAGLSVQAVGYAEGEPATQIPDEPEEGLLGEIHIYVTRGGKKELNALPPSLQGNRVLIHNTGKVTVRYKAAVSSSNRGLVFERDGRIACGSSCAPTGKNYAGTFGALVKRKRKPGLYAISNNHVFGDCNHVAPGMPIMAPAGMDGRPSPARAPKMICQHEDIVELRSGTPALVPKCQADLGIALVPDESAVSSWHGGDDGYDTPPKVGAPQRRLPVKKVGRTTGLTHGIIEARILAFDLPYEAENFKALVWFDNVWTVRSVGLEPFALGGDSGSLVVSEDGKSVVGMVFAVASKGSIAYIIPAECIVKAFGGIEFVTNHGV